MRRPAQARGNGGHGNRRGGCSWREWFLTLSEAEAKMVRRILPPPKSAREQPAQNNVQRTPFSGGAGARTPGAGPGVQRRCRTLKVPRWKLNVPNTTGTNDQRPASAERLVLQGNLEQIVRRPVAALVLGRLADRLHVLRFQRRRLVAPGRTHVGQH